MAAAGPLDAPEAADGSLRVDIDGQGKAAKKHKSRGGKLAASLSPKEVRFACNGLATSCELSSMTAPAAGCSHRLACSNPPVPQCGIATMSATL